MTTQQETQTAVRIDLGRAWLNAAALRELAPGSIVTLDTPAAGAVEISRDGAATAVGTLVSVQDRLGVRIDGARTT
ncbi:MAG: FliM/FliN family flagellar motor switch protein [Planctomycetaceae bacterium]|nr:FliM/FliN family flagellar motor switch protein [Planctomycetaceae bacterium]